MKDIAIYGAGGFGREVACLLKGINEAKPQWNFIGFFDDAVEPTKNYPYGPILGGIDVVNHWNKPLAICIAIGRPNVIERVVNSIDNTNINYPNIISPSAIIMDADTQRMGRGNLICAGCWISCNTEIGDFNQLNNYITIGHDSKIGNYNSFMPGVRISGEVTIGDRNLWGLNSGILQQKKVGNDVTIGAGSILLRNVKNGGTYVGVPAVRYEF